MSPQGEEGRCSNPAEVMLSKKICRACGARGVKNRCGGCRVVYFCDRECQKQVWSVHRAECQTLATSAETKTAETGFMELFRNKVFGATSSSTDTTAAVEPDVVPKPKKSVKLITTPIIPEIPVISPSSEALGDTMDAMDATPATSATPSSKKKKKHKKKKRSNSLHAPSSAPMPAMQMKNRSISLSAKKQVMWGEVYAREFTRFPGGGGAVPYDGTWALGLGSPTADVQLGSVLEVEELRLLELEARAKELSKSKRSHVRSGETRQFDYKSGARNPLFGRLSERERKKVFTESELKHPEEHHHPLTPSPHASPVLKGKSQRKRSTSSELSALDDMEVVVHDFACVSIEQLDEFAKIRDSREEACGCSCGDLIKKVSKMNVKKLHAFLADRDITVKVHSKPELLALAKGIALQEKNCSNSKDCECARNGVECHASVCVGCAGDCWNPHKSYMYKKKEVEQYRKQLIAKWRDFDGLHQPRSISVS
ncbi:hypothetical protein Poli38472_011361 [Pythium oligandrum]|uniref:MYND-type domain-containing protein n=1 Tax=Pythium oligandrum TaxID=41045 RepID=A0A8K1CKM9_PYTOL|nr:hypothetical protein Poli38472_011361 [Pythium oligandrum]|eukprot:TMW64481.1 hypothetical protein Poli38472_011361 [Pythium oligandrum]